MRSSIALSTYNCPSERPTNNEGDAMATVTGNRISLSPRELPSRWYNVAADLPYSLPPMMSRSGYRITRNELLPLFPSGILDQELDQSTRFLPWIVAVMVLGLIAHGLWVEEIADAAGALSLAISSFFPATNRVKEHVALTLGNLLL